jgi:Fe-S-cluster-containing dehydrogenase component/anaerobic selenocysteine-containing dehydrogenase
MSKYWKSIEEKEGKEIQSHETGPSTNGLLNLLEQKETLTANRRDFLKLFGFSVGVAAVASSCEMPVKKAIPYLVKPENITPGKASYFATSAFIENQFAGLLVKVRDGRPIKIEGNELSKFTKGRSSARMQAAILSLYDTHRFKNPEKKGIKTDWGTVDKEIMGQLQALRANNKKVVILTSTIISPSTLAVLENFKKEYPNVETVTYDAISASGILEANLNTFGKAMIPSYHFNKAKVVVNFGADFMGTWMDPIGFANDFAKTKDPEADGFSKLIQYESIMSLTGSNADKRIVIRPSEEKIVLSNLYNAIAKATGGKTFNMPQTTHGIDEAAKELLLNRGASIVVSGSNDPGNQMIVNAINQLLGNYGQTIDINTPLKLKQGLDRDIVKLKKDLAQGKVGGIIFYQVNPVYHLTGFLEHIKDLELSVTLNAQPDETSVWANYACPDHNYLESWNDFEPTPGQYHLAQPTIAPIFDTRQAQESLLKWAGEDTTYYDFMRQYWQGQIFPRNNETLSFENFWNQSLQAGTTILPSSGYNASFDMAQVSQVLDNIKQPAPQGLEIVLYEKTGIASGELANIPWLQEMPDPVTKMTWDNYLTVSPTYARENGLKTGDVVLLNEKIKIPVFIQPGQAFNTAGLALGYGRSNAGRVADGTGVNAYPLVVFKGENRLYHSDGHTLEKTYDQHEIATTQTHHSMEGRPLIRETTLEAFLEDPASGNEMHEKIQKHHTTLYKKHEYPGHHWGMAIDLTKCTGCSACVIACQVENNIPVVGKTEVRRVHEMHWIRIDRYYKGDDANPEVVRQPVMCQHCDNAPCENVCPVAATTHSSEGINQMAYNRCIGTRYCNNNCPYKVRRFNYFDYNGADAIKGNEHDMVGLTLDLPRMVLNPDVTIRAKGVIEKCSFCVQRIQEKKLDAKLEGRELRDGEITPACAQACPSEAIVFGDTNDPDSNISKHFANPRNYHLLEELHTLPSVGYLTKIRNKEAGAKASNEGEVHGRIEG